MTVAFDASADAGWVMVTLPVALQPLLSCTVNVYVPAVAVMLDVVALLLHAYVYGAEPPVGAACAVPVPPLQSTLAVTVALADTLITLITVFAVPLQPPNETVTEYVLLVVTETLEVVALLDHE